MLQISKRGEEKGKDRGKEGRMRRKCALYADLLWFALVYFVFLFLIRFFFFFCFFVYLSH